MRHSGGRCSPGQDSEAEAAACSLVASLLALDSEAAWELPELAELLLSLLELLWEAELLSLAPE